MKKNNADYNVRFKKITKIGFKHLKRKSNKLWLTIILCLLSSTFLLNTITAFSFDKRHFVKREYLKNNDNYIALKKDSDEALITDDNLNDVNALTNNDFVKGINIRMKSSSISAGSDASVSKYDNFITSNFLEYNDSFANKNFSLIAGTKPQNCNEILITEYTYQMFKKFFYVEPNHRDLVLVMNYEDIIGRKMLFNNLEFVIKGIVDTSFNYKKYEPLTKYSDSKPMPNNVDEKLFRFDYQSIIKYSYHTSIFVGNYDLLFQNDYIKSNMIKTDILLSTKVSSEELNKLLDLEGYKIQHYVMNKLETTSLTFSFFRIVISIAGILFLLFSILTQISYVNLSIGKSKEEIKVLSSVGFRRREIRYIFGFEVMFISISGSVASTLLGAVSIVILNLLFYNWYLVYSGVVLFYFWQPLVILSINIINSLLALFISFNKKIAKF